MKTLKYLMKFMKGNKLLYLGAILSVGVATMFTVAVPLVIKVTVDSIIGNEPFNVPDWLLTIIEALGGKTVLSKNLWICSIVLVILTLGRGLFLYLKGKWSAVASESIAKNMKEALYDHIQHLSYDYHVKAETGDLIQRCTSDVETTRRFLAVQFVEIGQALFMFFLMLGVMLSLNVRMTIVSIIVVPIIFIFAVLFFRKISVAFKEADESEARLSSVLQENLTGVRVVRAFARQRFEIDKFDKKNTEFRDLITHVINLLAGYWAISDFICFTQIGAVLVAGAYWASTGVITLGTLILFNTYISMLLWPIRNMGRILADMGKMMVSLNRIKEILDEPLETVVNGHLKPEIKGNIEFENVYFEYEEGHPIINNISFEVKQGMTVAILGPTGSGKTSLIHLLARLYDYQKGSIKIDGVELKDIDKNWIRKNIGIILQEPFLFSKTIRDNIRISYKDATEAQIYEASRAAYIHDVIVDFENGYDTLVGERGVTLSGGQKQRVAIARMLIEKYPVLVFDDSLSAVDTETDMAIRKALKEKNSETTTFIISHRVSTLSEADMILVIENGRLIQMGKHEELIKQKGFYNRIWNIQNKLEEELEKDIKTV